MIDQEEPTIEEAFRAIWDALLIHARAYLHAYFWWIKANILGYDPDDEDRSP